VPQSSSSATRCADNLAAGEQPLVLLDGAAALAIDHEGDEDEVDAELLSMIALGSEPAKQVFDQRSWQLMSHARITRKRKQLECAKVKEHVARQKSDTQLVVMSVKSGMSIPSSMQIVSRSLAPDDLALVSMAVACSATVRGKP
jgi:hypothetical protein